MRIPATELESLIQAREEVHLPVPVDGEQEVALAAEDANRLVDGARFPGAARREIGASCEGAQDGGAAAAFDLGSRAATRQALLDRATTLFAERGHARTSLDDIAAGARVTKGALYGHFTSKQALFRAVLHDLEAATTREVARAVEAAGTPWEGAIAGLDAFLRACCDTVHGKVVMREAPIALPYAEWSAAEELHSYGMVEGLIRAMIEAGEIDPLPVDPTARIVHAMIGAAAMLIAAAPPADQPRAFEDARAVVLRFHEGMRRR